MLPRPRRPPREILKSLDNKENNPDHHLKHNPNRQIQFRINKLTQVLTECNNSTSISRARTPVRGRLIQLPTFKEKSQSQKHYLPHGKTDDSVQEQKRYLSTKESVQQYQTVGTNLNTTNNIESRRRLDSNNNVNNTNNNNNYNNNNRVKIFLNSKESVHNEYLLKLIPNTCESQDYQIGPMIGKGSYAIVKLGNDKNAKKVALKIYDKHLLKGERLNNLLKEISTLRQINHEQIVKFNDVYHNQNNINLVLEYCGTESLYTLLKSTNHRCITKELAFNIIHQLLKILFYLHDRNICHRDIKLENVLISQLKKIKLIDFGFSTFSNQSISCHCGTPSYMAPEVVQKLRYDARASDIWALGVLFVCLIQGSFPFKGANERELFKKIRNNDYNLVTCDRDVRQFLSQIFILDPTQRATAKELLQQDLFRNM